MDRAAQRALDYGLLGHQHVVASFYFLQREAVLLRDYEDYHVCGWHQHGGKGNLYLAVAYL